MKLKILFSLIFIASFTNYISQTAGQAVNFDGVNDYVNPNNPNNNITNNFTFEMWARPTATHEIDLESNTGYAGQYNQRYALWPTWRNSNSGIGLSMGTNGITVYEHGALLVAPLAVYTGTISGWNHVAVSIINKQAFIYLNGTLVRTGLTSLRTTVYASLGDVSAYPGQAGGIGGGTYGFFQGDIDEFRLWPSVRTQTQIASSMNSELSCPTGVYAYYKFNHGIALSNNSSVTTATDFSGNNLTASLTSMALTGSVSNWIAPGAVGPSVTINSPTISSTGTSVCSGQNITLTALGATNGTWSSGGTGTLTVVTPTISGVYSVYTSSSNCSFVSTISINVIPGPSVNLVSSSTNTLCAGQQSTLSISGANTYTWFNGSNAQSVLINPTTSLTYSVLSTNSLGCTNVSTISVIVIPLPTVSVNSGAICSGNSFTILPSGANSYIYSGGSNVVSPLTTTSYAVIGVGNNGCISANTAISNVSVFTTPTITINSGFVCSGTSFTLSPTGASSYTFLPGGSAIVSPVANTSYTVLGSNGNSCVSSTIANIGVVANPVLSISSATNICIGSAANLNVSGANFYTWSTGSNNASINVSPSVTTIYSVTGVNAFGCISSAQTTVNVLALPVISVNNATICNGSIYTLTPSGASTYTYSSGSATIQAISNASYSITGTSAQGCISSNTAVANILVLSNPTVSVNSGTICLGKTFTIVANGGVTYSYSGGSSIVSPNTSTNYTVTGFGSNGCNAKAVSVVSVNPLPVLNVTGATGICAGNSTTLTVNGAATYTWSNGANTGVVFLTPTVTSNYTVSGTDFNGCNNSSVATITVFSLPNISVNNGSICSGSIFTMVPSGASTYTYSNGSNTVVPSSNTSYSVTGTSAQGCVSPTAAISNVSVFVTPTISVNSGAICLGKSFTISPVGASTYSYSSGSSVVSPVTNSNYTITGYNGFGCSHTAISSVTVNNLPSITISGINSLCLGNSTTLTASGALSYSWSNGVNSNICVISPTTTSNFTLSAIDLNACTNSVVISITVYSLPVISVNSGSICSGNSFTLNASGANSYTYSSGNTIVSPLSNSTYSVTGTSLQGCVSSNTAVASITVVSNPTISVNSGSICIGRTFTFTPSGASTYSYSSISSTVAPTSNTSYTVRGFNGQGCVSTPVIANVTVVQAPNIVVNSASVCLGNSFTLSPSGAQTYTYSSGSNVVSPTSTSIYSITGTSSLGCVSIFSATTSVNVFALPAISATNGSICLGKTFTIIPTGASSYTYSSGSNTVSPSANTNYSIIGTSSAGCLSASPAIITVSVLSLPVIAVNSGSICAGSIFTIQATGASSYTYSSGASTVNPLISTSYSVIGTNSLGCVSNNTAISNVTVLAVPQISVSGGAICAGNNFTINPSGAQSYVYSSGTNVVSPSVTTTYTLYGTGTNGCVSLPVITTVSVSALPTIAVTSGSICSGNSFTFNPTGANSYTISGGSLVVSPTVNTTYTINGTSVLGCINQIATIASITVYNNPLISVTGPTTTCQNSPVSLIAFGASNYTWSTGFNTSSISVSPSVNTTYSVLGTNAQGCSNNTIFILNVNPAPLITVNNGTICSGNNYTLNPSGALSYTYSSGSAIVSPNSTTNYSITGTNAFGCISINAAIATVSVYNTPTLSISGPSATCVGNTVNLTASGALTYIWNNGSTSNSIVVSPTVSATYSVIGSNANCNGASVFSLTVNALPNIILAASNNSLCVGESATLMANGASSYTWANTGANSSSIVVSPTVSETYTLVGSNISGCVNSGSYSINVDKCTGMNHEVLMNDNFEIYPNPSEGQFFIQAKQYSPFTHVYIISLNGSVVFDKIIQQDHSNQNFDISHLAKGVYEMRIMNQSELVARKKIILMH